METRLEILRSIKKESSDVSYSASMRRLRKNDPENVYQFMKSFKEAFDRAIEEGLDDPENLALMEARKSIKSKDK